MKRTLSMWSSLLLIFYLSFFAYAKETEVTGKVVPFGFSKTYHLIVPVTVDGKGPLRMVFDTGATGSYISPSAYKKYELKQGGHTLQIGELNISDVSLPPDPVPGYDGILGTDVIMNYVFKIDLSQKQITFYEKNTWKAPVITEGSKARKVKFTSTTFQGRDANVLFDVYINNKGPILLCLDTGCPPAAWLLSESCQTFGIPVSEQPVQVSIKVVDGIEVPEEGIATTTNAQLKEFKKYVPNAHGVIGSAFVLRFIFTVDTVNKEVIFEPVDWDKIRKK